MKSSAIVYTPSKTPSNELRKSKVHILINGVMIEEHEIEGLNLPEYLALDLPYTTKLPESRNEIVYDKNVANSIKSLIKRFAELPVPIKDRIEIANGLAPIIAKLEERGANINESGLEDLSKVIKTEAEKNKVLLLPNHVNFRKLKIEGNIGYLSEHLPVEDFYAKKDFTRWRELLSKTHKAYVVDFEDREEPMFIHNGRIFIDKKAAEMQAKIPALLMLYMDLLSQEKVYDSVHMPYRPRVSNSFILKDSYPERLAEETLMRLLSTSLDSIAIGIFKPTDYLILSYEFKVRLYKYLTTQHYDLTVDDIENDLTESDREILSKLQDLEVQEIILKVRDAISLCSPEFVQNMINLSSTEVKDSVFKKLKEIQKKYPEFFTINRVADNIINAQDTDELKYNHFGNSVAVWSDSERSSMGNRILTLYFTLISNSNLFEEYSRITQSESNHEIVALFDKYLNTQTFGHINNVEHLNILYLDMAKNFHVRNKYYELLIKPYANHPLFTYTDILAFIYSHTNAFGVLVDHKHGENWENILQIDPVKDQVNEILKKLSYMKPGEYLGTSFVQVNFPDHDINDIANKMQRTQKALLENGEVIINNLQTLLNLPIVKYISSKFDQEIHAILSKNSRYTVFSHLNILLNIEGYINPFTDYQISILTNTLQTSFDLNEPTREDAQKFLAFLQRALSITNLDDELFEFVQPVLSFNSDNFEAESEYSYENTPRWIFSLDKLQIIHERFKHTKTEHLLHFLEFYHSIASYRTRYHEIKDFPMDLYFHRILNIWEEISSLPDFKYKKLVQRILKTKNKGDIVDFLMPDTNLAEIPEDIRAYVLYLREGSTVEREEQTLHYKADIKLSNNARGILLTDLINANKLKSTTFDRELKNLIVFPEWIASIVQGKDKLIAQREINHAIHYQSSDEYLFLRQLMQNSLDTINSDASIDKPAMFIDELIEGDNYILQISDPVGMDFETIMKSLFMPESSSTFARDLGGFASIFQNSDEIFIQTTKNDTPLSLHAIPLRNDEGDIIDIQIYYDSLPESVSFTGSNIQAFFGNLSKNPLRGAHVKDSAIKYGSYVESEAMQIYFNGELINEGRRVLAEQTTEKGTFKVISGSGFCITQNGIYVAELSEEFLRGIPENIRDLVIPESSFVLDIPADIPLTTSRNDIAQKENFIKYFTEIGFALATKAFINRFAHGEVDFSLLPYDYFWRDSIHIGHYRNLIPNITESDAKRINTGKQIKKLDRYYKLGNLLELLTIVDAIPYKNELLSLRDIAFRVERQTLEHQLLPQGIQEWVQKAIERKTQVALEERSFYQSKGEQLNDFELAEPLKNELIESSQDIYVAFLEAVQLVTAEPLRNKIKHAFYYRPDGTRAHANFWNNMKSWNLLSTDKFMELLSQFVRFNENLNVFLNSFWYELLEISTHEDAHLLTETVHWTQSHNEVFYNLQRKIIAELMYSIDLVEVTRHLNKKYRGQGHMSQKQYFLSIVKKHLSK